MKYALTKPSSLKKKYYALPIMRRKPKKSEIKFVLNLSDFTIKNAFLHKNLNPFYPKELLWGKNQRYTFEVRNFIPNYYAMNCKKQVASSRRFII